MDQLLQCPVCTLYLHNGMTLESHLDTHPKDQVIKALCNLTGKSSIYGSRTPTPSQSERSYRSRSRTPATEDRWNGGHRNSEHDRYWRRTPSRASKSNSILSTSRNGTPDIRMSDINFENTSMNGPSQFNGNPFVMKTDKIQPTYQNMPVPEFDPQYVYYPDQQEDREIKYSRSAEYSALNNNSSVFAYNVPTIGTGVKLQTTILPTVSGKGNGLVKILPKTSNILLKTNVGGMQYIAPGVKPMHVVVPTTRTFLHKNVQNNMILTNSIPTSQMVEPKSVNTPLTSSQFNHISAGSFTPGTTVVTQNSQIIYREMVHNLEGKPFISNVPTVLSENVTNVAQASSLYQNVMVVDQFGNTSCMYTPPQSIIPKTCHNPIFNDNASHMPAVNLEKPITSKDTSKTKTLIIEVGPIPSASTSEPVTSTTVPAQAEQSFSRSHHVEKIPDKSETKTDLPGTSKGLKILSNIKVEVPVQHHKHMINTIMDLTGLNEPEYMVRPASPEKILPDLDDSSPIMAEACIQPSTSKSVSSHTFSVIKNVGNPPSYKDSPPKTSNTDNKIDAEFSDSCPVPDLICKEKPSVSPCSELSEQGDNSTDHTSILPKPSSSPTPSSTAQSSANKYIQPTPKPFRNNTLRLNNIYIKKHKKILQIKNAKSFPVNNASTSQTNPEPRASSSTSRSPEHYTMTKMHQAERSESREKINMLETISVEQITDRDGHNDKEFDADTEEQSMDIEPVAPSSLDQNARFMTSVDVVQVKEEESFSNEPGTGTPSRDLTPLETLRPIKVITYTHMPATGFDDESNHRELLDLEATSKNKQFVNMMNENYFGDNIYADYFTPDRVQTFDAQRPLVKDGHKDYIWGESSQKESEFVLPNFIHESYKIAESNGMDYSDVNGQEGSGDVDGDACEQDSKADVLSESHSDTEPPLNICADERMPPRGDISGQESNGDMESPWSGMYTEVTPAESYDLLARESWASDASDVDSNEKREAHEEEVRYPKGRACGLCGARLPSAKELRAHKALVHALPTCSTAKTTYRRLVAAKIIKKEEKADDITVATETLLDPKKSITTTILQVYDVMNETKPKIEALIPQETKRRRRDYVCPTCKVDQLTDVAFHAHLKIHPLECLTCGKCFYRRANLALHMKTHLGIKNYKCDVCEKRFLTRQKLAEHHNVHTGRAPFKCTLCDDSFRRYSNMVQHRDRHHFQKKAKVRDFVCRCGAVFHSRAKLHWHAETHDERPKACLYCSDKFVHAASLTRHVRRAHNACYLSPRLRGKVDNVPCPVCKQLYLRTNLRAHMLTHSGKRPYVCVICNKAFTTKWNLKLHRWTHMSRSAKPYKCTLCKGAFIRHTEYISHMNAHKSVKPYTCNYCGCQFIRKYNCQRHVREHEIAKKYVCKVAECGKSFHRSYYLSEHMKVHSGARPFSCNICGKTSSNKSNHNKHVKIHHAREPVATEA